MNYQTLTELQARAIVHGDALKAWQRHAAEKAVTRLLQDAADTASEPATGAETIARHKSLCAPLGRSVASDEAAMLRRLLTLPALPAAVANRIVTGTATLADALVALDLREDLAAERGRLRSAAERFAAKATNLLVGGPAQVSARAGAIDTLFNGLSHADFALTQSSWSAFRSRVRRVAAIVDPDLGRTVKRSQLSGTWATLVAAVDQKAGAGKDRSRLTKQEQIIANHLAKLWPLIAFCVRRGQSLRRSLTRRFKTSSQPRILTTSALASQSPAMPSTHGHTCSPMCRAFRSNVSPESIATAGPRVFILTTCHNPCGTTGPHSLREIVPHRARTSPPMSPTMPCLCARASAVLLPTTLTPCARACVAPPPTSARSGSTTSSPPSPWQRMR